MTNGHEINRQKLDMALILQNLYGPPVADRGPNKRAPKKNDKKRMKMARASRRINRRAKG